jgi:hypothetical protein
VKKPCSKAFENMYTAKVKALNKALNKAHEKDRGKFHHKIGPSSKRQKPPKGQIGGRKPLDPMKVCPERAGFPPKWASRGL